MYVLSFLGCFAVLLLSSYEGFQWLITSIDPPFTWAYKKMEESVEYWESKGWTTGKGQKKSVKAD